MKLSAAVCVTHAKRHRATVRCKKGDGIMGAEPYWYFVPYESDINGALRKLREREFKAGRYHPALPHLDFPLTASSPSPGARHASIAAARLAARENGTRSILDIETIGPHSDFGVAGRLNDAALKALYGTTQPTHQMVEDNPDIHEPIERGQAVYVIVYKDGQPDELFFAGYSYD